MHSRQQCIIAEDEVHGHADYESTFKESAVAGLLTEPRTLAEGLQGASVLDCKMRAPCA